MFTIKSYIDILPIISYVLAIAGYVPEIYSLVYTLTYKKPVKSTCCSAINGGSIWLIWIAGSLCYAAYAIAIRQYVFIISYAISASLCSTVFILKMLQPTLQDTTSVIIPSIVNNSDFISPV